MKIDIPITDHVAVADRMCRELLLICPDPNGPDFEGREDELRLNSATRSMLHEAMDIIAHQQRMREIQFREDDGTKNPRAEALRSGLAFGEEMAAKRLISRFALAFNGY